MILLDANVGSTVMMLVTIVLYAAFNGVGFCQGVRWLGAVYLVTAMASFIPVIMMECGVLA